MGKFQDLTGKKFGRLTVIKRAEDHISPKGVHETQWLCKCDCGNEKIVVGNSLKSSATKSCGCITRLIDLTGQKFGRLTVIKRVEDYISPKGWHETRWLCQCDCGNETNTTTGNLRNGTVKSCGCYSREKAIERSKKYNEWFIDMNTNVVVGTDSKGNKFTIDAEDWLRCKDYCWGIDDSTGGYVRGRVNSKIIGLHRFIMNPPDDMVVDHINGDLSNNCRSNLRICTSQQNAMNHKKYSHNTSGHTGVSWNKNNSKWEVHLSYKGNRIFLGNFTNLEGAIKARKDAEVKYYGEYRRK